MDKFLDSFAEPLVLIAFLNFAGIAISAFFSWQASKSAQKSIAVSQVNTAKLDTMKEKVQKVKDKVEHIETHTNSMQDELLRSAKKEGIREGIGVALTELKKEEPKK